MNCGVQGLHALLEVLGITETFLLGRSIGSAIALQFTLKYPDLVKALIHQFVKFKTWVIGTV